MKVFKIHFGTITQHLSTAIDARSTCDSNFCLTAHQLSLFHSSNLKQIYEHFGTITQHLSTAIDARSTCDSYFCLTAHQLSLFHSSNLKQIYELWC